MKKASSRLLPPAIALLLGVTHIGAQGNILVNGDFETGNFSGWNELGSVGGAQVLVNGNDVESGSYAADILLPAAQTNPLLASQFQFGGSQLPTTAGQTYLLTFWYAVSLGTVPANNVLFDARWNLDSLFSTTTQSSWGQVGTSYTEFSTLVTGGGSDNLIFYASNVGSTPVDVYLDNVSLVATPEPTSLALLVQGCVMLLSYSVVRQQLKTAADISRQLSNPSATVR